MNRIVWGVFKFKKCCPHAPIYVCVCVMCIHPLVSPLSYMCVMMCIHPLVSPISYMCVMCIHPLVSSLSYMCVDVHPPSCEPRFIHVCDVHDGFYALWIYVIVEHLLSLGKHSHTSLIGALIVTTTPCQVLIIIIIIINHSTPLPNGSTSTQL